MCIYIGATVRDVFHDPAVAGEPRTRLASGEVLYADLVIAADTLQKIVTGFHDRPKPTGDTAYHPVGSTGLMLQGPEFRPFAAPR
jgi:hypothetical protein